MKLVLKASVGSVNRDGVIVSKYLDPQDFVEIFDGIEMDGVLFSFSVSGKDVEIILEGKGLSDLLVPNYMQKFVYEIKPKTDEAKFTANLLNRFTRKFNKKFPDKIIMIKSADLADE